MSGTFLKMGEKGLLLVGLNRASWIFSHKRLNFLVEPEAAQFTDQYDIYLRLQRIKIKISDDKKQSKTLDLQN